MSRKIDGISRKNFNNEKLEKALKTFKEITSCIEDIIKEPDDGSGKSMSKICVEHGINYVKLRSLISLETFNNIYADNILSANDMVIEEDPYEILYRKVFDIKDGDVVEFPIDLHESIDYVINDLAIRYQEMFRMRFGLDGNPPMTLRQIAEVYNISVDRISQIERKIIRILRHPSRSKIIRDGLIKTKENDKKIELDIITKTIASEKLLKEYQNDINKIIESGESVIPIIETEAPKIRLDELEFSVRTYNCLKRSVKYNTLYDLLLAVNPDLMKLRNFGKNSLDEVDLKINKYLATYGLNRRMFLEINGLTIDGEKIAE